MPSGPLDQYGKPPTKAAGLKVYPIANPDAQTEVVGEYYRQESIIAAVDRTGGFAWATLRPEPHNRHDSNAVSVWVGGNKIGFIDSTLAEQMQPNLLELQRLYRQIVACPVEIDDSGWPSEAPQASLLLDPNSVINAARARIKEKKNQPHLDLWPHLVRASTVLVVHRRVIIRSIIACVAIWVAYIAFRAIFLEARDFIRIMF